MKGQIDFTEYLQQQKLLFCSDCVCSNCLFHLSSRCPHGGCYDDKRAIENPYDKAHPNKPPRTAWTNWNKPGEQAHWCRGGTFYPVTYCDSFIKYHGCAIKECLKANVTVYQDGYIDCSLIENYGEKFFQTEEEAIKRCEELAKSQKTKQYARYERVCRVKAVE